MKKMVTVTCEEARDLHGIVAEHTFTPETGEYRFRLIKNDKTAYIRAEAGPAGGWQDSHFHRKVLETYIVQSGWMGFAVEENGNPQLTIYCVGEQFTTPPMVIHNVYLPSKAVIHTVKHGDAAGEQRLENEICRTFTALLNRISEEEILGSVPT